MFICVSQSRNLICDNTHIRGERNGGSKKLHLHRTHSINEEKKIATDLSKDLAGFTILPSRSVNKDYSWDMFLYGYMKQVVGQIWKDHGILQIHCKRHIVDLEHGFQNRNYMGRSLMCMTHAHRNDQVSRKIRSRPS